MDAADAVAMPCRRREAIVTQEAVLALDYYRRRAADPGLPEHLRRAYGSVVTSIEAAERIADGEARIATDPSGRPAAKPKASP
jgi:hypothetical protein